MWAEGSLGLKLKSKPSRVAALGRCALRSRRPSAAASVQTEAAQSDRAGRDSGYGKYRDTYYVPSQGDALEDESAPDQSSSLDRHHVLCGVLWVGGQ